MKKKRIVATPEKKIAVLGGKPISSGATTVEPNIASVCCSPSATLSAHGSRSSGAITPARFSRQENTVASPTHVAHPLVSALTRLLRGYHGRERSTRGQQQQRGAE